MSTIMIPGQLVEPLRRGAYLTIGMTGEALGGLVNRRDREALPERFAASVRDLNAACALLDALGWSAPPGAPRALALDLRRHRVALLGAIVEQSQAHESGADDALGPPPCDAAQAWARVTDMQLFLEHLELACKRELAAELHTTRTRDGAPSSGTAVRDGTSPPDTAARGGGTDAARSGGRR